MSSSREHLRPSEGPGRMAPVGSFAGMSAPALVAGDADGVPARCAVRKPRLAGGGAGAPAGGAARPASEHLRGASADGTRVQAFFP